LLFGLGFAKAWYKAGIVFQILVAVIATGLSWAVVFVASLASPAERIDENTRLSNLELRSVGALFIWAFATQMVMVFRGQDDESSDQSNDDSSGTL
jgi:hypothetical protein